MHNDAAVYIRNACKSYGSKEILKNLSLTVPKGSIYGLLGASGCGKTTLLSCVVGRKLFNSGELWVLGGKPGTIGSGVPGPRVGYMPQDIALVGEFTVLDSIYYFGLLSNKKKSEILANFKELRDLLDLPPDNRYIKDCSGGQQRRVSFAAALINKPELLILDEPTVGVDPVLRDRIWTYLLEITQRDRTAVIITTHYIEETRQANLIGLLRGGRLLAESSPTNLLRHYNTDNLEEVFLILSKKQEAGVLEHVQPNDDLFDSTLSIDAASEGNNKSVEMLTPQKKPEKRKKNSSLALDRHRIQALMNKNWKQFSRNTSGWIFLVFFPVLEILGFLWAVGPEIKNIPIAIINNEDINNICGGFNLNTSVESYGYMNCHFNNLSCRFLEYLNHPMLDAINVESLPEAIDGIRHGKYSGAIYLSRNYSSAAEERFNSGADTSDNALNYSTIKVYLDMSNRQIGLTIKFKLLDLYMNYQKSVFLDCNFEKKYAENPIRFIEPVYGQEGEQFTEFMAPGILNTLAFFSGALLTSQIILTDRLEGVWDRSAVAGVTSLEITLTHFVLQFFILLFQNMEIFVLAFYYHGLNSVGSLWVLFLIVVLEGINGMACGFWISIVSTNHSMANILTTGTFYPMILLCGVMWPLEGQPKILRMISQFLPFTIPTQSFRNVFMKGWGLNHLEVLNGIGVELAWLVLMVSICIYKLKNTH